MTCIYDCMQEELLDGQQSIVITVLEGPHEGEKSIYRLDGTLVFGPGLGIYVPEAKTINSLIKVNGYECFVQAIEKDPSVLVLGAGHVSRAITDLLLFVGCQVTVVDDRPEYLVPEFFDARVKRTCLPMDAFGKSLDLNEYNGFIIVTRAHEYDNVCLSQLKAYLPTYMGIMGSHKRISHAFDVLRAEGWSDGELAQVYAPIGLDIDGQTPNEIALSIVSEYLAVTRGKKGGHLRVGK